MFHNHCRLLFYTLAVLSLNYEIKALSFNSHGTRFFPKLIEAQHRRKNVSFLLMSKDDVTESKEADNDKKVKKPEENKAMQFLRSKGLVGGASDQDFINAMGVDEGPAGGKNAADMRRKMKKARGAYEECTSSGVIDDMSETFPFTSSGNSWAGVTDRIMGGSSSGSLSREEIDGKVCNILRGKVSLENNGGFVQMATDLALNQNISPYVDASKYGKIIDFMC